MRKLGFLIFLLSGFLILSHANEMDSVISKANAYYADGFYLEAIDTYKEVLNHGYISADIYYNIGNAYFKLKNTPYAILYYERALALQPEHEDARHNLTLANAYIMDKIDYIPDIFIKRWKYAVVNSLLPKVWLIISLSAFSLFLLLFLTYFFSTRIVLKKFGFWFGVLFFLISVFTLLNSRERREIIQNSNKAIIISPVVTVKSSPNESGTNLFVLHEGTKVSMEDKLGNWTEIKIADGNKGWVKSEDFEEI